MIKRILETEVMDTQAEAFAYDDMDHSAVNQQFVSDLLAKVEEMNGLTGEVLDLGTGTARIPVLLCDATEDLRVFAIDMAVEMLEVARMNIELGSHIDRIMLARCDAKQLDLPDNRFDVVMSNSIVHHIPDPASTFAEAVRVCRPGGLLFFRDLIRPQSDQEVDQLVETYAGNETDAARKMFDDSLHAAFTVKEIQRYVEELGFAADSIVPTSDRHWTWAAVKPGG